MQLSAVGSTLLCRIVFWRVGSGGRAYVRNSSWHANTALLLLVMTANRGAKKQSKALSEIPFAKVNFASASPLYTMYAQAPKPWAVVIACVWLCGSTQQAHEPLHSFFLRA